MTRSLRTLATLAVLLASVGGCGSANAQTSPGATAADVTDAPPAARVVVPDPAPPSAAPSPMQVTLVGRPSTKEHLKKYAFPVATLPGFEMLPDGGSRLFVEITKAVGVEQRHTSRVLTYILKGTRVVYRNNENSLVTVHFNTPVTRARLLPSGNDLLFSVDLRADAAPAWRMVNESDGTATLQIDFQRGSFLPAGEIADESLYGPARPPSAPPPPPLAPMGRGKGPRPAAATMTVTPVAPGPNPN